MAEHLAFSEVHLQSALEDDSAFMLVLEEIEEARALRPADARAVELKVFPFYDIELVKRMLLRKLGATSFLKISDLQIYHNGVELGNRRLLITFGEQDLVTFRWKVRETLTQQLNTRGIRGVGGLKLSSKYLSWLEQIMVAFQSNVNPKLTDEGTGSTYILYNVNHKPIAVFKPQDEEAFCPLNPRGYVGRMGQKGFRTGVVSGEGALREVAAYYLDAYYGSLSHVPPTILVEAIHPRFCYDPRAVSAAQNSTSLLPRKPRYSAGTRLNWKSGSLQMFVDTRECCGDYDPSVFSVSDVHKIGILDIRACNLDRNEGNLLVVREEQKLLDPRLAELLDKNAFILAHPRYREQNLLTLEPGGRRAKYRLIPIDHGLTLPDTFDLTDFDLIWLRWPQAKIGFSRDELEYIERLRPDKDAEWLRQKLDLRPSCLRTMQVSTRLLQKGAKLGLTLHQIAMLMVRLSPEKPSMLENWVKLAISQTWQSCYQSSLVRQRSVGMNCVMDLATPLATNARNLYAQFDSIRVTSLDESISADKQASRVSATAARGPAVTKKPPGAAHRKIKDWRTTGRIIPSEDQQQNIWTVTDVSGRVLSPDWDDPQVLSRFFDAFENILCLRMSVGA